MVNYIKGLTLKVLIVCLCTAVLLSFQGVDYKVLAAGTVYYVDQNNPLASDSNSGTEALPWKTISKAASTMVAGDKVYVKQGTYRESIKAANSGTSYDNMITYEAYPGHTVVIKGSEVVSGWVSESGYVWKKTDFDPENQYDNPILNTIPDTLYLINNDVRMVIQQDAVLSGAIKLNRATSRNDMTAGTFYMDITNKILYVWLTDDSDPNNGTIEVGVRRNTFIIENKSYIKIKGFQMRHNSMLWTGHTWPGLSFTGDHIVFEDNIVSWMEQAGLGISASYCDIKNNTMSYNGYDGFGIGKEYNIVDGNTTEHNNLEHWCMSSGGGGGKYTDLQKSIVKNHRAAYNFGPGLWFDSACKDNIIENSVFHDNIGPGIMNEISTNTIIRNNLCYRNDTAVAQHTKMPTFDPNMKIIRIDDRVLDYPGFGIYNSCSGGTKIYNNTVVGNNYSYNGAAPGAGIVVAGGKRWNDVDGYESVHDVIVKNNIIYNNGSTQLEMRKNGCDADTYGNVSDNNLIFRDNGANLTSLVDIVNSQEVGYGYQNLTDWYNASGFDQYAVNQDPLLSSYSEALDYYLTQNSPAINAGADLTDMLYDNEWIMRKLGTGYDMGAYEFSSGLSRVNPGDTGVTTVLNDTGTNGNVVVSNWYILLPDEGDKVQLTFNVASAGYYKLDVKERSGLYFSGSGTDDKDYYWRRGAYKYVLDNKIVLNLKSNIDTIGPRNGGEYWGIARTEIPVYLEAGTHTITFESTTDAWTMVSYFGLRSVPGMAVNPNGNTTIINDTGSNGSISISDWRIVLPDNGDKVKVTFTVDSDGYYNIQTGERSGDTGNTSWYWINGAYKYVLDDSLTIKFTGDSNTIWNQVGDEYWGLANTEKPLFLKAGTHYITYELTNGGGGGMMGYLGIWQVPGKAINPGATGVTTVLNETGTLGNIDISNWHVTLPDTGDKIKINFTVDSNDFYIIDANVRSGLQYGGTTDTDCYWDRGAYTFNIDDVTPVNLYGDISYIGPLVGSYEYWGISRIYRPVYLTAGNHYITLESTNDSWIMLSYLGIR